MRSIEKIKQATSKPNIGQPVVQQYIETQRVIQSKTTELNILKNKVADRLEDAKLAGDTIFNEAKIQAKHIMAEAQATEARANNILAEVTKQQLVVDALETELQDSKTDLEKRLIRAQEIYDKAMGKEKALQEKDKLATDKLKEANDILNCLQALLIVSVDTVKSLSKINDDVVNTVSQNLTKTANMYQEIIGIKVQVASERAFLKEHSDELALKEVYLADRGKANNRAQREIRKKETWSQKDLNQMQISRPAAL